MKYFLAAVLCIPYSFAEPLNLGDFADLHEEELVNIQRDASDLSSRFDVAREESQVVLNYLYIAARSAKCEQTFVKKYAEFRRDFQKAQLQTEEGRSAAARRFAALNKLALVIAEHTKALHMIEEYIDDHEQFEVIFRTLQDRLMHVLNSSMERRAQAFDMLLMQANDTLNQDTMFIIAKFCKMLAQEPELLIDGSALAIKRVDIVNKLSQEMRTHISAAQATEDAMNEVVYFTLLVTYHYFKECYAKLYIDYQNAYSEEPRLMFTDKGMLGDEQKYLLPKELLV